jgi:hypothetical protein
MTYLSYIIAGVNVLVALAAFLRTHTISRDQSVRDIRMALMERDLERLCTAQSDKRVFELETALESLRRELVTNRSADEAHLKLAIMRELRDHHD